jgi:2-polyprenyl-3-methyl-5-hydroxy-6-metoxy-1,4-benzoquinol methylase
VDHVWRLLSEPRSPGQDGYFEHVRKELVDMIGAPPRRFVEIGCGTGVTAAEVKRRYPDATVEGFEVSAAAGAVAAERIDTVHIGDIERTDLAALYAPQSIDTLLLADVLEHLYDPWKLLVRLRPLLSPDAQIISSIPNIRNMALLNDLAYGTFTYEPAGLLDVTHIRFFTRYEIMKMFEETGYEILTMVNARDPRIPPVTAETFPVSIEMERIVLKNVDANALAELQTIQFYLTARPKPQWAATPTGGGSGT